ncbi:MAG TPA: hypothetical protein DCR24_15705 [Bacillus bacterium]|nr:hypothetical protein [Bacillus sp. (in: firmicutes)]
MNSTLENNKRTAEIFMVIAELYKPPTREFWNELKDENLLKTIRKGYADIFKREASSLLESEPSSFEQICSMYAKTISDGEAKAALPVESLYKPWTQDETCTLPFSKSEGYLQGDSALHIRYLIEIFQIEIPLEYAGMPDHLSILLELLAYFIEHAQDDFTAQFLADHFDWLEEYEKKLAEVSNHPFYPCITKFLIEMLDSQRSAYK